MISRQGFKNLGNLTIWMFSMWAIFVIILICGWSYFFNKTYTNIQEFEALGENHEIDMTNFVFGGTIILLTAVFGIFYLTGIGSAFKKDTTTVFGLDDIPISVNSTVEVDFDTDEDTSNENDNVFIEDDNKDE